MFQIRSMVCYNHVTTWLLQPLTTPPWVVTTKLLVTTLVSRGCNFSVHPAAAAASATTTEKNARQRRSAARSARRNDARRAQMCTHTMLSLLFVVRLRRMVEGTLGVDHEVSSVL